MNPDKEFKSISRGMERVASVLMYFCMFMLAVMMFLGSADVIGRYVLDKPISGTLEIFEILLPGIVMFGIAYVQIKEENITIDVLTSRLSPKAKTIFGIAGTVLMLAMSGLFVWRGMVAALVSYQRGLYIMNLDIPIYIIHLFVPIGILFLVPVLIIQLLQLGAKLRQ